MNALGRMRAVSLPRVRRRLLAGLRAIAGVAIVTVVAACAPTGSLSTAHLIATPIVDGSEAYLKWLGEQLAS